MEPPPLGKVVREENLNMFSPALVLAAPSFAAIARTPKAEVSVLRSVTRISFFCPRHAAEGTDRTKTKPPKSNIMEQGSRRRRLLRCLKSQRNRPKASGIARRPGTQSDPLTHPDESTNRKSDRAKKQTRTVRPTLLATQKGDGATFFTTIL